MAATRLLKMIVVGDSNVGKTSVIVRLVYGRFDEARFPTIGETLYHREVVCGDGHPVQVNLIDTTGVEDYGGITSVALREADIVVFVVSLDDGVSVDDAREKWAPQVDKVLDPECHLRFVVVNKNDLDPEQHEFGDEQSEELAKDIKAVERFTVSARTGDGIEDAFAKMVEHAGRVRARHEENEMVITVGAPDPHSKKGCC